MTSHIHRQAAKLLQDGRRSVFYFRATSEKDFIEIESSLEVEILVSNPSLYYLFVGFKKNKCRFRMNFSFKLQNTLENTHPLVYTRRSSGKTTAWTKERICEVTSSTKFELFVPLVNVILFCVPFFVELQDAVVKRKPLKYIESLCFSTTQAGLKPVGLHSVDSIN